MPVVIRDMKPPELLATQRSSDPPLMLFGLFVLYGLSGYVFWGYQALRGRANPARSVERDR